MTSFLMNGYFWRVKVVDPMSPVLIDRTNERRVATTDPLTRCVYLSKGLSGDFKTTVLLHELGHCVMFSYGLIDEIHAISDPEDWVDIEEMMCNFIADYGQKIFQTAQQVLGDEVWDYIPYELDRWVS